MRSKSLLAAFACLCSLSFGSGEQDAAKSRKTSKHPHVIFFLIDDAGYADFGYNSDDLTEFSPNMDAAAADGIKLTNYYTQEQCTPARASLLTGKYPTKVGMQFSTPDLPEPWGLPLEFTILPEVLKFVGKYKTEMVGKWHLGFSKDAFLPENRGFDNFFGYYYGKESYYDHQVTATVLDGSRSLFNDMHFNGRNVEALGRHSTEIFQGRVEEILSNHDVGEPLFLFYSHQLVHVPLENPPDEFFTEAELELAETIDKVSRRVVGKMLMTVDKMFAHLVDNLKANGMYDNSIIVVTSDNGGCSYYMGGNQPLRGEKNTVYEGGVKVNAFVHSPLLPRAVRGTTYDDLFHISDWFPTLLEGALGFETGDIPGVSSSGGNLDGYNQWGPLTTAGAVGTGPRHEVLHTVKTEENYVVVGLRRGDYKLVMGYAVNVAGWYSPDNVPPENYCEILHPNMFDAIPRIFNIREDPSEENDLYDEAHEDLLHELWQRVDFHWDEAHESAFVEGDTSCYKAWADNEYYLRPWQVSQEADWGRRGPNQGMDWRGQPVLG
mmetsp:Transcript_29208/g.50472  ORF Transcript_29208/g.50472 Transcript_29208/m.50472 type:complete len:549 (+) Transcript_29208:104-1750(+)